jgi:Asp-tRNA(Asn)/Glu-tRNA(Gln) amidotransferase A subunit family amidase
MKGTAIVTCARRASLAAYRDTRPWQARPMPPVLGSPAHEPERPEHPVSLAEIASAVRERRVSAVELVRTWLERIDRLNAPINAVIGTRPEEALAEAEALDARVAAGEDPGALAGVPLLVKDNERLTGMRTTHGSTLRRNVPPETEDGHIPRRLRAAGAIAVGKTNVPEFTFAGYTVNELFGATSNPWNLEYSPGGSSGGSAAAMAAGLAPLATATDGGGSIRIPASFCGLAGLKPTNGVIARDPIPVWIDLSTYGPLGHSVADVRLLLELERGPTPGDPSALPVPLPLEGPMPARAVASARLVPFEPPAPAHAALFEVALERISATSVSQRNSVTAMKRSPPASAAVITRISRSATSRTSTKLRPSRGIAGMPMRRRSIARRERDRSAPRSGPMISPGLTAAIRSRIPRSPARPQAARSASVLERA